MRKPLVHLVDKLIKKIYNRFFDKLKITYKPNGVYSTIFRPTVMDPFLVSISLKLFFQYVFIVIF